MNKRTAIALAAGVVVALLIGIASVSLTTTPLAVAEPGSSPSNVRTVDRTVTVHRTASPTASMSPVVDDHGVDGPNHDAFDDHGNDGVENEAGDDHGDDGVENEAADDHGDDDAFDHEAGDDNSGPGSDNSGSGSDDSGHDGSDD
jgi:hypothetical protein